jgi:uncharacterized membrane protein YgcG
VPDNLPRRRAVLASAAALPVLLGTASCRSQEVFTGPDPLAGPPRPAPDVITLQAVIAAEQGMIQLYQAAMGGNQAARARGLEPLLAEHQQHLARLRARLIVPPGASATSAAQASSQAHASSSSSPGAGGTSGAGGSAGAGGSTGPARGRVTIARLRAAERASAAGLVQRLGTVEPALAQLFASIAASDATHVTALGG